MFSLLAGLFSILAFVLWVWAVIDVMQHLQDNASKTIIWLIIIIFFPVVGSLVYFWVRNRTFNKERNFDPDFGETV
jgi:heme/copper-type cytochrome/quinol oxidase subunit 2